MTCIKMCYKLSYFNVNGHKFTQLVLPMPMLCYSVKSSMMCYSVKSWLLSFGKCFRFHDFIWWHNYSLVKTLLYDTNVLVY